MLEPLSDDEVVQALVGLNLDHPRREIESAAKRAGGSVKDALRLLEGESGQFDASVHNLLARLPNIDWRDIHALGDAVAGRDNEAAYESLMANVFAYLDHAVRNDAARGAARLQPYAEAWEKILDAARQTEVLNLDKRPLILSIFADLGAAARASQRDDASEPV
jgi:DNA polymerase-3 subunit delta'